MSAYKWLRFALGIPLIAVLLAIIYEFARPAVDMGYQYSSSEYSNTGLQWYAEFLDLLPFILLSLLAFMLVVGIVNRRRMVR